MSTQTTTRRLKGHVAWPKCRKEATRAPYETRKRKPAPEWGQVEILRKKTSIRDWRDRSTEPANQEKNFVIGESGPRSIQNKQRVGHRWYYNTGTEPIPKHQKKSRFQKLMPWKSSWSREGASPGMREDTDTTNFKTRTTPFSLKMGPMGPRQHCKKLMIGS